MTGFARNDEGGVLVTVVVYAVALFALLGVVIDLGRTYSEQTRMQGYLDSVAIAAAAELDGRQDAIDRARWIIDNGIVRKSAVFSRAGTDRFEVDEVRFLDSAPNARYRTLDKDRLAGQVTYDPAKATHVLLTAKEREVPWTALRMISASEKHQARFRISTWAAAAPVRGDPCMTPILAMCAPDGETRESLNVAGRQLLLEKNEDGDWESGEYGLVADLMDDEDRTCAGYSGAARQVCLLAINSHQSTCETTVDLAEGGGVDVSAALNTRFDIWSEAVAGLAASRRVSPDLNVIKGDLHACTAPDYGRVTESVGLPVDPCFADGTCETVSDGGPGAALELYWARTQGGALPGELAGATRHEVYRREVDGALLDPRGPEDSTFNICNPAAEAEENRRAFQMAVVDCGAVSGKEVAEVEVKWYAEVFLGNPVAHVEDFAMTFDGASPARLAKAGDAWMAAGDVLDGGAVALAGTTTAYDAYARAGVSRIRALPSHAATKTHADAAARALPMLFDTANPTGDDDDLAHTARGNVLIVSEDGDASDPDDSLKGGWLVIGFSVPTHVKALRVLDAQAGGVIRLYDAAIDDPAGEFRTEEGGLVPLREGEAHDPRETARVAIPEMADKASALLAIDARNVRTLAVFLPGTGAIDDLSFANEKAAPEGDDALLVEMIELVEPKSRMAGAYPVLTD